MRDQILARYIPLVAYYIASKNATIRTTTPLNLYGLNLEGAITNDEERLLVRKIADYVASQLVSGATVKGYIAQLCDDSDWSGRLVRVYKAVELDKQREGSSILELGIPEYGQQVSPSSVPPAIHKEAGVMEKNIKKIQAAASEKVRGQSTYPQQSWLWRVIFKPLLMSLPFVSIVSLFSAVQELKSARSTGNRTWGNFILLSALSACVAIPSMMISLSLFGMPAALGAFGVAMSGLGIGMVGLTTKVLALTALAPLVANPIGAAILGAVLALVILAVVATVIYKGYQAYSAWKDPEKFIKDSSSISPDMEEAYKAYGYNVAAVQAATKGLVKRIQDLETRTGPAAAGELAKLKGQLGALRGYYAGILPNFSPATVVPKGDPRWIKAYKALKAYREDQRLIPNIFRNAEQIAQSAAGHNVDYALKPRDTASSSSSSSSSSSAAAAGSLRAATARKEGQASGGFSSANFGRGSGGASFQGGSGIIQRDEEGSPVP